MIVTTMIVTAMIVTLIVVTAMLVTALTFEFLREVLHESFVCTCSADSFLRMSRTKASFSHAQLSVFEGCLAQKLPFHKLNFKVLKEVSHEMRACCDIFFGGFFRFWRVSFSFTIPFKKASTSYFFRLWCRDPVLEQVLARMQIALEWLLHQGCSALLVRT
jgi:hypothetical protein